MDEHDDITIGQFNRFLAARAPDKACPECGTNEWISSQKVDSPDEGDDTVIQVAMLMAAGSLHGLPLHTQFCSYCGYLKTYSAVVVEAWVRENG